jgi:hypothetical protein
LAGLVKTKSGQLFGTAAEGGKVTNCVTGCGHDLPPHARDEDHPGRQAVGAGRLPGHFPAGGLLEAADGWLYGTTALYRRNKVAARMGAERSTALDTKGNVTTSHG